MTALLAKGPAWVDVKSGGASATGKTLDTRAINGAIADARPKRRRCRLFFPGTYLTVTIVLQSNVTLHLEPGATLLAIRDLREYDAILPGGPGAPGRTAPDPGARRRECWFSRRGSNRRAGRPFSGRETPATSPEDPARDLAGNYWKHLDRPSTLVEFAGCRNVRIENVRIDNAPGWTLRTINCDRVFIRGVSMKADTIAAGIVPTCRLDVVISDCILDTGDDPICLSGNP